MKNSELRAEIAAYESEFEPEIKKLVSNIKATYESSSPPTIMDLFKSTRRNREQHDVTEAMVTDFVKRLEFGDSTKSTIIVSLLCYPFVRDAVMHILEDIKVTEANRNIVAVSCYLLQEYYDGSGRLKNILYRILKNPLMWSNANKYSYWHDEGERFVECTNPQALLLDRIKTNYWHCALGKCVGMGLIPLRHFSYMVEDRRIRMLTRSNDAEMVQYVLRELMSTLPVSSEPYRHKVFECLERFESYKADVKYLDGSSLFFD